VREIFAVTDNRENFLTAKISRYTVLYLHPDPSQSNESGDGDTSRKDFIGASHTFATLSLLFCCVCVNIPSLLFVIPAIAMAKEVSYLPAVT